MGGWLMAACLLASVTLWACGAVTSSATEVPATPDPCPPTSSSSAAGDPEATQTTIACVGTRQISEATFQHWRAVAMASESHHGKEPRPNEHKLVAEVMGFLISAMWVQGEARDLHVHVSTQAVRNQFNRIRKEQFPRRRAFRRFLRQTKQTVADLLLRVELNILSQRIQRRATSRRRGPRGVAHAMSEFVKRFRVKWTNLTYCTPQYAVQDCGHVQSIS